ncbi:hypothetical protein CQ14_13500 [Bradyrhizobium lablabi]|uniref:Uncharacterized protein n=1 Tax=Bradyrhizobium lablabi TaxID=722472 RepID=A0A0R3M933_9BRAD|nr:hypothetical protein CQ14_13500 [Bradyrhizobium lablabi]
MTIGEFSEDLPVMPTMMAPFVMTATPVPSIVMTATSVSATVVAVSAAVLDLDHGAVLGGQGRDAYSGGRGQGHCQRSNQCRANQNDTSHAGGSSQSLDRDVRHKFMRVDFVPCRDRMACDRRKARGMMPRHRRTAGRYRQNRLG